MDDSEFRERWSYRWAGPEALDVLERDSARTTRQAGATPPLLAVRDAEGVYVEDCSGRVYLDLHGNNCHHLGYKHPNVLTAVHDQLGSLTFNTRGFTNPVFVEFAERLCGLWHGRDARVFLVPGGSAAVEVALAVTRVHTARHKTLSFKDSFHGRSLGAIGLTTVARERSPRLGPLLPGTFHVPSYKLTAEARASGVLNADAAAARSLEAVEAVFKQEGDIGCFIAEAIGNGGFRPPRWYWEEIRRLCDKQGTLLIFDDVPLGLGKTGAMFTSEHFPVVPDGCVLGKALGGTLLPAAALLVGGHLDGAPELDLGYFTHEKNPLMAAVALATLDTIVADRLVDRAGALGAIALERLQALAQRHSAMIAEVRGVGLMLSFDIRSAQPGPGMAQALARSVFLRCLEEGLILNYAGYGSTLRLSCPLVIGEVDLQLAIERLDRALSHCSEQATPL